MDDKAAVLVEKNGLLESLVVLTGKLAVELGAVTAVDILELR